MQCVIIALPCFNSTAIALSLLQSPSFQYYVHEPSMYASGIKVFLERISEYTMQFYSNNTIYKIMATSILNINLNDQRELRAILEASNQIILLVRVPTLYAQSISEKTAGLVDVNHTDIQQYQALETTFEYCQSVFPEKLMVVDTSLIKSNPEKFLPELCNFMAIQYDQNMIYNWHVRLNGPERNVFLGYEHGDPWATDTFVKTKLERITRIPMHYNTFEPSLARPLKDIANKVYLHLIDSPQSFGGLNSGTIATLLGKAYSNALGLPVQDVV